MTQSEKLKVLIEGLKTSNELMKKQIEIQNRTIELLGDLIIEPKSLGKAPHSDKVPSLNILTMVGKPINIRPEDMKAGEWYADSEGWLFKFYEINDEDDIITTLSVDTNIGRYKNEKGILCFAYASIDYCKATREEVIKYFPHEFEIPTHGGNDVPNIERVTDEQL